MTEPFLQSGADASILVMDTWQKQLPGLVAGFTTRVGGVSEPPFSSLNFGLHTKDQNSDVLRNREILSEKLDFPLEQWILGEQVHGKNITVVSKHDSGKGTRTLDSAIPGVDGLITKEEGVLCAAFFADCVPLFFLDIKKRVAGIAHAGWKGTVAGMAEQMVEGFIDAGSEIGDLRAAIGPCISGTHYEVDHKVMEHIDFELKELVSHPTGDGKFNLDLRKMNELLLLRAGLSADQIDVTKRCTFEDEEQLFSFRRDQGNTGRMLGYIGFKTQTI